MRWALAPVIATLGCGFQIGAAPDGDAGSDAIVDASPDAGTSVTKCAPLPAPASSVPVADLVALRAALASAAPGTTLALATGKYDVSTGGPLVITTAGVTLRSANDDPDSVVITGGGVQAPLVIVQASDVTVASLTVAEAPGEAIRVEPTSAADITGVTLHDLTLLDNDGPAIRLRPAGNLVIGPFPDNGTIACSRFRLTPGGAANPCLASAIGISGVAVRGWTVRANRFERLACTSQLRRTVWFLSGSRDTTIVGNVFVDSAMNIMLGESSGGSNRAYPAAERPASCSTSPDHWGGVVCNNAIAGLGVPSIAGTTNFEEGIALWNACEPWVLHNTVVSPGGVETYHDIEYRFSGTFAHLVNNLLLEAPASRDLGKADPAYLASNVLYGATSDFVDAAGGDLHLSATASISAGASIAGLGMCDVDADGRPRELAAPTPGAYER